MFKCMFFLIINMDACSLPVHDDGCQGEGGCVELWAAKDDRVAGGRQCESLCVAMVEWRMKNSSKLHIPTTQNSGLVFSGLSFERIYAHTLLDYVCGVFQKTRTESDEERPRACVWVVGGWWVEEKWHADPSSHFGAMKNHIGSFSQNFINLNNQRLHTKKDLLTCKKVSLFLLLSLSRPPSNNTHSIASQPAWIGGDVVYICTKKRDTFRSVGWCVYEQ